MRALKSNRLTVRRAHAKQHANGLEIKAWEKVREEWVPGENPRNTSRPVPNVRIRACEAHVLDHEVESGVGDGVPPPALLALELLERAERRPHVETAARVQVHRQQRQNQTRLIRRAHKFGNREARGQFRALTHPQTVIRSCKRDRNRSKIP
eukprot:2145011-Pleurochrysis_carterae.AAC.2